MKKIILICIIIIIGVTAFSQPIINRSGTGNTVSDFRLQAKLNFYTPRYQDTTAANIAANLGIDSCGAQIFTYDRMAIWFRSCYGGSKQWMMLNPSGAPSFGNYLRANW